MRTLFLITNSANIVNDVAYVMMKNLLKFQIVVDLKFFFFFQRKKIPKGEAKKERKSAIFLQDNDVCSTIILKEGGDKLQNRQTMRISCVYNNIYS